jgi:hypothetical protein
VVLDRAQSGNDSLGALYTDYGGPRISAEQVRKSFILHATGTGSNEAGNPFTLSAAQATAIVGTQRLDLRTLLPQSPVYRVIKEDGDVGQYRLEYEVSGSAQSYLLNVIGARDASDVAVSATLHDLGNSWRIELSHPGKGTASLLLQKGATSNGGSVRIDGGPELPLRGNVHAMLIDKSGPIWPSTQITGGNMRPRQAPSTAGSVASSASRASRASGDAKIGPNRRSPHDRR